jgi:hypothetical protein
MVKNCKLLMLCFFLFAAIHITACGPGESALTEVPVDTEQVSAVTTSAPTVTVEIEEPSPEPVETEETVEEGSDDVTVSEEMSACVSCHTDKTMLIDTAAPQEEVESENEGAG